MVFKVQTTYSCSKANHVWGEPYNIEKHTNGGIIIQAIYVEDILVTMSYTLRIAHVKAYL